MFDEFLAYAGAFVGGVTIAIVHLDPGFGPIFLTGAVPAADRTSSSGNTIKWVT